MNHYVPFTPQQRDALIEMSLGRAQRNIHGDLGPRCLTCSGLGSFLKMGSPGAVTRNTSTCRCHGSGIDLDALERHDRALLWQRIQEIESRLDLPATSLHRMPTIEMTRQYFSECVSWLTTDGTAVASSAAETILVPNVTLPANYMNDGRSLLVRARGKYSTLGSGTVTHVYRLRWGGVAGTLLAASGTVTLLISMTNALFEVELEIQNRSNGATGTLLVNGQAVAFGGTAPTIGSATGAPAVAPMTAGGQTVPAAVTCDLTADTALALTIQHGASSGSNTATGLHHTIESRN
jgi:hypothetical protein